MTTILALLGGRWAKGLALGAAFILLLFALDRCASYAMSWMQKSATEAGVQKERAETNDAALKQVEKANEAGQAVRRAGGPDRASCLQDSRTPENCQ